MSIKVAIIGYGRIGRNILRALYESGHRKQIQIVAINDLGDAETNAYLTRFDTVHGKFRGEVRVEGEYLVINGDKIQVVAERDPSKLPWGKLGVDVVLGMHRAFHQQKTSHGAHHSRCQKSHHLSTRRQ